MVDKNTVAGYLMEAQMHLSAARFMVYVEDYEDLLDNLEKIEWVTRDLKQYITEGEV